MLSKKEFGKQVEHVCT